MTVLFKIQMNEKYVGWKGEEMVGSNSPLGWKNGADPGNSSVNFVVYFVSLFSIGREERRTGLEGITSKYRKSSGIRKPIRMFHRRGALSSMR